MPETVRNIIAICIEKKGLCWYDLNRHKLISEMSTNCPLIFDVILAAINHATTKSIDDITPRIGMCYSIIMQTRNHELSLNKILWADKNARKKVIIAHSFSFNQCKLLVLSLFKSHLFNVLKTRMRLFP